MDHRRFVKSPRFAPPPTFAAFILLVSFTAISSEPDHFPVGDVSSVEAVVHATAFNGACWLLSTKYGPLEATNLGPEYKDDGLKVIISFRKRDDLASTCMMGWIVTLLSISRETAN